MYCLSFGYYIVLAIVVITSFNIIGVPSGVAGVAVGGLFMWFLYSTFGGKTCDRYFPARPSSAATPRVAAPTPGIA